MSTKSALIAELVEYGVWYKYHEYYDLYRLGEATEKAKKRMKVADIVRRWKNREEKTTGVRPVLVKNKKVIPAGFKRNGVSIEESKQFFYSLNEKENFIALDQYSSYPMTEEEMYKFHSVDPDKWMTHEQEATIWEQGAKIQFDGEWRIAKTPLHRYKIRWKLRKDSIGAIKKILLENITLPDFSPAKINTKGLLCVEMMLTDFHLGKVGFDPTSMEFNWTIQEAAKVYNEAIDYYLSKMDHNDICEFLLPIGNDFINIDNPLNETTKGTPQMTGEFWEGLFRYGKNLCIATIEKLSKIAPVKVKMVKGNHDSNSVFTLGEVLSERFRKELNVDVVNEFFKRPYHRFGNCLIGYDHGNRIKRQDVYKAMSLDRPKDFGETIFRAMHLGHLHKNSKRKVMEIDAKDEINGVEVEICPSISPTDRWHYNNLYIGNIRRSKSFVWHKKDGLVEEHYFNLKK